MPAPKGNKFWMLRSSHGLKPMFDSPDQLWSACVEYFDWVQANPLFEAKAFAYKGEVTVAQLPKMRAMTIEGLCIFLNIHKSTWIDYRNRERYRDVTARVDAIIRTQKFEGAAAKLLNGKIITRDLGLVERRELDARVEPGGTLRSIEQKPLWEQMRLWGNMFHDCVVEAALADDEKALETAKGWLMHHIVPALKGEDMFGNKLKENQNPNIPRKEPPSRGRENDCGSG